MHRCLYSWTQELTARVKGMPLLLPKSPAYQDLKKKKKKLWLNHCKKKKNHQMSYRVVDTQVNYFSPWYMTKFHMTWTFHKAMQEPRTLPPFPYSGWLNCLGHTPWLNTTNSLISFVLWTSYSTPSVTNRVWPQLPNHLHFVAPYQLKKGGRGGSPKNKTLSTATLVGNDTLSSYELISKQHT